MSCYILLYDATFLCSFETVKFETVWMWTTREPETRRNHGEEEIKMKTNTSFYLFYVPFILFCMQMVGFGMLANRLFSQHLPPFPLVVGFILSEMSEYLE